MHYIASGMIGAFFCLDQEDEVRIQGFSEAFLKDISGMVVTHICRIQQIPEDELIARMKMFVQFAKVNQSKWDACDELDKV